MIKVILAAAVLLAGCSSNNNSTSGYEQAEYVRAYDRCMARSLPEQTQQKSLECARQARLAAGMVK